MSDRREVVRVLLSSALCVDCIQSKTGMTREATQAAIEALDVNLRLKRESATCRSCLKRRIVLTLM